MSKRNDFPNYGSTSRDTSRPAARSLSDVTLFNQLSDNISCNIFSINNNVAALESAGKDIGTHLDSDALRDKIHKHRQSINELVGTTTRFFTDMQRLIKRGAAKEQQFQARRLENEFRETVKRYDLLQTELVPKMTHAVLMTSSAKENRDLMGGDEDKESFEEARAMHFQQQQMQQELEFEHGLLLEREQRIRQIESDILDVNATFRDLGQMIHEQGDNIGTIEENITTVAYQVEAGNDQLAKASQYQKSYRTKLCWLLLILLIIAAIIAIVIVVMQSN